MLQNNQSSSLVRTLLKDRCTTTQRKRREAYLFRSPDGNARKRKSSQKPVSPMPIALPYISEEDSSDSAVCLQLESKVASVILITILASIIPVKWDELTVRDQPKVTHRVFMVEWGCVPYALTTTPH